ASSWRWSASWYLRSNPGSRASQPHARWTSSRRTWKRLEKRTAFSSTSYPRASGGTSGVAVMESLLLLPISGYSALHEQPPLVASDHAGQEPAARRHVDDRAVGDAGDHARVAPADSERVDVEALQAHLHV